MKFTDIGGSEGDGFPDVRFQFAMGAIKILRGCGNGVFIDFDYRGKGLQLEYTVDDPNVFTMKWGAKVTYLRAGGIWQEQVCAENTREYYDDADTKIPAAVRPDF